MVLDHLPHVLAGWLDVVVVVISFHTRHPSECSCNYAKTSFLRKTKGASLRSSYVHQKIEP